MTGVQTCALPIYSILSSSSDNEEDFATHELSTNIDLYLKEKRIDIDQDPLEWWKVRAKTYPELSDFARSYLACPPSSVASERLFSGAGQIYDEKRSRLSAERAEKLLFLKFNLPTIEFEY